MDISKLVTQDNADAGIWFTVELYGEEQDFQLRIFGDDSDAVAKYLKNRIKKVSNRTEKKKVNDQDIDEILNMDTESVIVRLNGIRGVKRSEEGEILTTDEAVVLLGRELKNDPDDYAFLIEKIPEVKSFVFKVSKDRTNFLSDRKKN